ncbi:helicase-exonuclease AddAB subunit AddB [Cohnella abietis]|uniref:ATP-dependent helicase/deoxyribonuclease subunit B n=1 Tax=Cohnella abietis TaxID=2507935 RepID=A0A3T1D9G7_9BACL|nr:helicase-exonuclease AddAB subunit AddB [Cohnella abietis]BBI34742.1 ATP-dependent helicase/deoxyribonuclease subunit B [Cohnella abietis]
MSLRLITGRSGSGKTTYCLDEIRGKLLQDSQGAPLILLVPEQATFQAEYAMVTTPGLNGFMRAQVLSFRRLAFRIMQETGGSAVIPIHDNGKAMLLHKVLEARRESLRLFRGGKAETGLISRINDLLTEMKRYGISSAKLSEQAVAAANQAERHKKTSLLADKLHDLSMIYSEMEQQLVGHWLDGEDMLGWLAKGAESSSFLKGSEIWLDGFHGYTPNEYAVIEALVKKADKVSVTLCLDQPYGAGERPDELDVFHPTAETSAQLCEIAQLAGVKLEAPLVLNPEVLPRFKDNPMLAFLEQNWSNRRQWNGDEMLLQPEHPLCGLSLHAAVNRRAEAEAVARDMLRRVREEGSRWRDMALFIRRIEDYGDLLAAVFGDYGIPYYLDGKKSVSHHPFVEFIRSALECVTGGWKAEAVFRCAKTDLLGTPDRLITRDEIDRLENYTLAAGIDGWRWKSPQAWFSLYRGDLEEEGVSSRAEETMKELLEVRDALLKPLLSLEERMNSAGSTRELCESLYYFLEDTGAADKLESWSREDSSDGKPGKMAVHRPLWDGVIHLLDQLVELMGEQSPDLPLFAGMVDSGLEELKLGAVPPSLDSVLIGSPERTRSDRVQVVYLLGVNDGVLPMRISENGLLAEEERDQLAVTGLSMAPDSRRRLLDESFLAYLTLTTASRHLWVSYPLADEEGQGLLPSEWIGKLKKRFPGIPVQKIAAEPQETQSDAEQLDFAVHPGRAITHLLTRLRSWRQGETLTAGWWSVYNWLREQEGWKHRLSSLISSLNYTNEEKPLAPETSRLLYGDRLLASVSRMERFIACPFQHFAVHGLKLQERRLFRVDSPDIGQLFHAALRQTTEKLFAEGQAGMDALRWQIEAAAAVDKLLPRVQSQILLSSNRHQVMARKLRDIVMQASTILGEHAALSAFKPVGLEMSFGPQGLLPALSFELDGGRWMDIAGKIDRVDAAQSSSGLLLRIMDYKSSAMKLRLDEVAHGLSLQMLTYLDVVVSHAPHWLGQPAKPVGVLYFHVQNPLLLTPNGMPKDEAKNALFREYRMQGLLLSDGESVKLMDESLNQANKSAVVPVEFKKDGTFSARSQVANQSEWEVLRGSVRSQIRRIGKRIIDGDVAITPYRLDKRSPCTYCDFRPVCHFDSQVEGNAYQSLHKPGSREELWQRLANEAQGREPY